MATIRGPRASALSASRLCAAASHRLRQARRVVAVTPSSRAPRSSATSSSSIVAFDKDANTFTVKVRDTGEIQVVRADRVIGTVPGAGATGRRGRRSGSAPSGDATREAARQPSAPAGETARPAPGTELPPACRAAGIASGGVASGTGVITELARARCSTGARTRACRTARPPPRERPARRILASGPGYSIKAGDRTASGRSPGLSSSEIPSPARGVALERRYEPMICQGQRLLHIDGRNLEFEGDAITAEGGCEIHITNSHIIAHGLGVSARAANVHIKNSVIEGESGSVSASEGAQVYTQSSTFKGLSRRLDTATFHDLGGTVWN